MKKVARQDLTLFGCISSGNTVFVSLIFYISMGILLLAMGFAVTAPKGLMTPNVA
jgi:hypothetical protein